MRTAVLNVAGGAARVAAVAVMAFAVFGPLANLVLWAFAERWYTPHALPVSLI